MTRILHKLIGAGALLLLMSMAVAQERPLKFFISVDMEGIGGIGTSQMTRSGGKDYALGRRLVTAEVNTVVEAIRARHPDASILVNDSHGDMRNLNHLELHPEVTYIQGNIKPLGMVQGLDSSFDGAIFLGYHTRAGTENGFLAHTGSGSVKGLWLNGLEVGEGGLNAAFAGALGVPIILAAGDTAFAAQIKEHIRPVTVSTKDAVGAQSCRLLHPDVVRKRLQQGVEAALARLSQFQPWDIGSPIEIRMRFATTAKADVLQAIPGMSRLDGFMVGYTAGGIDEAYRLIRLMYKYVQVN